MLDFGLLGVRRGMPEYDGFVDGEPSVDFVAEACEDYSSVFGEVVDDVLAQPASY